MTAGPGTRAGILGVLRDATFGRLFGAQVVALLGTGLLTVALALLAFDLAGSRAGTVLGTALAVKMAAYVLVAPLTSALTWRLPPRAVLIGSDGLRGLVALLLPFVDHPFQIYVLVFVLQAASATFTPAFQALLPSVLPDEQEYTRALALSRSAYDLESLVSPVAAAALLSVLTYDALFLLTVAGFAASAALVYATALPRLPGDGQPPSFHTRLTRGMRLMAARPALRALLALNVGVAAATALVVVNTVVYVHELLGGTNTGVAGLLACFGGGSMVAALLMPRVLSVLDSRVVMLGGAAAIPAGLVAATSLLAAPPAGAPGWWAFGGLWCVLGAATSSVVTPSARLLRDAADPAARPSVFAAQFSLSHAGYGLTYPLAGWLGAAGGHPQAAGVLAAIAAVAAAVAWRLWTPRPTRTPLVRST